SIAPRSFARYGRIEGRYPRDREPIGVKFLWMKRSAKGPNTFSDHQGSPAGTTVFHEDVYLRLQGSDQSPEKAITGGDQIHRPRRSGRRRTRYEAVIHGNVCLQPGAAYPGVDHLSLEGLQSAQ